MFYTHKDDITHTLTIEAVDATMAYGKLKLETWTCYSLNQLDKMVSSTGSRLLMETVQNPKILAVSNLALQIK